MRVSFRSLLEMYAKSINPAISAVFVLAIAICLPFKKLSSMWLY